MINKAIATSVLYLTRLVGAWDCWQCPCDLEHPNTTCCCGDRICCGERSMDYNEFTSYADRRIGMTDNVVVLILLSLIAVAVIPCIVICYQMLRYRARMRHGLGMPQKVPGSAFQLPSETGIAQGTPGVYQPHPTEFVDDDDEPQHPSAIKLAGANFSHTSLHNPSILQWKVN